MSALKRVDLTGKARRNRHIFASPSPFRYNPSIREANPLLRMDWLLAITPLVLLLLLMVRFRWSAARAGAAGWLLAMALAGLRFGAGFDVLAMAQVKALLLAVDVLMIIWAAYLLFRVTDEAGAIDVLGQALPGLTRDRGVQALLIGWAFASFLQGVGGFGVPVAVTAPLLVGLGFTPLQAVVIPSVGHAWAVTFGSLATSFQALIATTGIPGEVLAPPSTFLLALTGLLGGFMVARAADGWQAVKRLAPLIVILAVAMGGAQHGVASLGLWNLAGLSGGLTGLGVGVLLAALKRGLAGRWEGPRVSRTELGLAVVGYAALILFAVSIQLVPALSQAFGAIEIRVHFPELATARGYVTPAGLGRTIPLFRHAGALLSYAAFTTYIIYRWAGKLESGDGRRLILSTVRNMLSSSVGILSMVGMAVVMSHAGMTEVLAKGLAELAGAFFPFVSPWIGALGAFITGSNTNSNVLFAMLQRRTAEVLGYSPAWILAAQTAGGAVGSVLAPTKIVVGASTTGLAGKEGVILKALVPCIAILVLMIGLGVGILLWVGAV